MRSGHRQFLWRLRTMGMRVSGNIDLRQRPAGGRAAIVCA
jgi:hypothetical protein